MAEDTITVIDNGQTYTFPADATEDEINEILGPVEQQAAPEPRFIDSLAKQLRGYDSDILSGASALPRGAAQLIAGALSDVGNITGMDSMRDYFQRSKQGFQEHERASREETTSMPLRVGTEIATGMAGSKGLQLGKAVGEKIAKGAGAGFMFSSLLPSVSDTEKATQATLGTVLGGTVPAAVSTVSTVGEFGANLAKPFYESGRRSVAGQTLRDLAGDSKKEIIKLLRANKQLPGGKSGAGEVAAPAGRAEFSAAQRISEQAGDPSGYRKMRIADDTAREKMASGVSGTADDRAAAAKARSAKGDIDYELAYKTATQGDEELAGILADPYSKTAAKHANDQARSEKLIGEGDEVAPEQLTRYLHLVRQGYQRMLNSTGDDALQRDARRTVSGLMENLTDWMKKRNPAYDTARQNFADASKPINQMEVGKVLREKLVSPLAEKGSEATQRAAMLAQGLRDAPKTIKTATGQSRHSKLGDVLDDDQVKVFDDIAESLARRVQYEKLSGEGMTKAREVIGDQQFALPATGPLNQTYMIVKTAFNRLVGNLDKLSFNTLQKIMRNPEEVAQLLEEVPISQRQGLDAVIELGQKVGIFSTPELTKAGNF